MFRKVSCRVSHFPQVRRTENSGPLGSLLSQCCCKISGFISSRFVHVSPPRLDKSRKEKRVIAPKDEGTEGETRMSIDAALLKKVDPFPTESTYIKLFNGVPYEKLPICHIRVSKNNTIYCMTQHDGAGQLIRSCGIEGFKNARKGTNIAAQATAITFSQKALELGFKTIRVKIQGLGPGRASSIKGLQMGGMDIVSITDDTRVSWNPARARKPRRL